jgi:hypothetical protein
MVIFPPESDAGRDGDEPVRCFGYPGPEVGVTRQALHRPRLAGSPVDERQRGTDSRIGQRAEPGALGTLGRFYPRAKCVDQKDLGCASTYDHRAIDLKPVLGPGGRVAVCGAQAVC